MAKVRTLILFLISVLSVTGAAQNRFERYPKIEVEKALSAVNLIPFERNKKWGYINSAGKIVVEPIYERVGSFSDKLGLVTVRIGQSSKSGFIDETGRVVIQPKFARAFRFSEGLASVCEKENGPCGYIDHSGNFAIPAKFDWAGSFSEGLAIVVLPSVSGEPSDGKSVYIDKSGTLAIETKFDLLGPFSNGLALVAESKPDELQGYSRKTFINKNGQQATPFYDDAKGFGEGLAPVKVNNLWGFIDTTGTVVIAPEYDSISWDFREGYATVTCVNGKMAFIDRTGRKLTDCTLRNAGPFREGLAWVEFDSGERGFMNKDGKLQINLRDDDLLTVFENGLARVATQQGNRLYFRYIDHAGKVVVKPYKVNKWMDPPVWITNE